MPTQLQTIPMVPWWRVGTMWLVVGGLGVVVAGSVALAITAGKQASDNGRLVAGAAIRHGVRNFAAGRRIAKHCFDVRRVGRNIRNHDDDVARLQRRLLFEALQQLIVQHFHFAHRVVTDVHRERLICRRDHDALRISRAQRKYVAL